MSLIQTTDVFVENLNVDNSFKGTQWGVNTMGMAIYQGLWSFAGWYNLNYVTEELKRPEVRMYKVTVFVCVWCSCTTIYE